MPIKDIDPPPIEPVDLSYVKTFLRVDSAVEDGLLYDMILSARIRIETLIRTSLIARRRRYTSAPVTGNGVFINHSPVNSIEAVTAIFEEGSTRSVSLEKLEINLRCSPVSIRLKRGAKWVETDEKLIALDIDMEVGFGAHSYDVPMPIRQAVMLLVAEAYEHRLQESEQKERPSLPLMVDALLMPYRTLRL